MSKTRKRRTRRTRTASYNGSALAKLPSGTSSHKALSRGRQSPPAWR